MGNLWSPKSPQETRLEGGFQKKIFLETNSSVARRMDAGERSAFERALNAFPQVRSKDWKNVKSSDWWISHLEAVKLLADNKSKQAEAPPTVVEVKVRTAARTSDPASPASIDLTSASLFQALLKIFIDSGMDLPQAGQLVKQFKDNFYATIQSLSLDDIERIASKLP